MLSVFLPGKAGINRQHLIDAGLGDLMRPDDRLPCGVDLDGPGPGGQCGQVWSWCDERGLAGYFPDRQTWHEARGAAYWYAFDHPIAPVDGLARVQQIQGRKLRLGDGRFWQLPSVEFVPCRIDLDRAGQLCRIPDPAYQQFVDEAGMVMNSLAATAALPADWDWQRQFAFLVATLQLNYRVNAEIVTRLGLIRDTDLIGLALNVGSSAQIAAIFADLEKKRPADAGPG